MHRFFIASPIAERQQVYLTGEQSRQIAQVLRLRGGDRIILFDGTGYEFLGEIYEAEHSQVAVEILQSRKPPIEPEVSLTLGQSLLKGDKMEWVIQKATELGVEAIQPLLTERTVVDLPEKKLPARMARWQRVAVEASEQSGRVKVPGLLPPTALTDLMRRLSDFDHAFMPWEQAEGDSLIKALRRLPEARRMLVVIGPEGGFSEREAGEALRSGTELVSLGPRILRAETAAIASAALVLLQEKEFSGQDKNIL